jgi:hypothetical protein
MLWSLKVALDQRDTSSRLRGIISQKMSFNSNNKWYIQCQNKLQKSQASVPPDIHVNKTWFHAFSVSLDINAILRKHNNIKTKNMWAYVLLNLSTSILATIHAGIEKTWILEVFSLDLGWDTTYPDWGILWFYPVPPGCWGWTLIISWPLPSQSFSIHPIIWHYSLNITYGNGITKFKQSGQYFITFPHISVSRRKISIYNTKSDYYLFTWSEWF